MRIAVSGTHASGKTTLIEAWIALHPEYAYEPEPYVVLQELHGEEFADPPAIEDFERQLEFQTESLTRYAAGANVVFERSPADFLAYMLVLAGQRSGARDAGRWTEVVRESLQLLDMIVFLPLDEAQPIDVPAEEDLELRDAVDARLQDLLLDDSLELFAGDAPVVIEARGTVDQRMRTLQEGISRLQR